MVSERGAFHGRVIPTCLHHSADIIYKIGLSEIHSDMLPGLLHADRRVKLSFEITDGRIYQDKQQLERNCKTWMRGGPNAYLGVSRFG